MRPRTWLSVCAGSLVLAAAAPGARAQVVGYLSVAPVAGAEPRMTLLEVNAATGEVVEIEGVLDEASWLYGLGEHGSHNYTALMPEDRGSLRASELLETSQAVVFGIQRRERVVSMGAAEFGLLAARAGIEWASPEGVDEVRVRRIEASKVIVRTAQPEGLRHAPNVTDKRGERAEIRPLFDPTMVEPESIVPVRVYVEGDGAGPVEVIATHVESGVTQRVRADSKGIAILTIDRGGAWRVEFHQAREAPAGEDGAEWVVYSGTLSFEVVGGGR